MNRKIGMSMVIAALAAAALSAASWEGATALGIEVKDKGGKPIAGATVRVRLGEDPAAGPPPAETGADGTAVFGHLAEGEWHVEVSHPRYMAFTAYVHTRVGKPAKRTFSAQVATTSSFAPMRVEFVAVRSMPPAAAPAAPVVSSRPPAPRAPEPVPAAPVAPAPQPAPAPAAPSAPPAATPATPPAPAPAAPQAPRATPPAPAPATPQAPRATPPAPPPAAKPAPTPATPSVPPAAPAPPAPATPPAPVPVVPAPAPAPASPPQATPPPATPRPEPPPAPPAAVPASPAPAPAPPPPAPSVPAPSPAPTAPTPPPTPAPAAPPVALPAPLVPTPAPAPAAPAAPAGGLRAADLGNCPDCKPGQWAAVAEESVGPASPMVTDCALAGATAAVGAGKVARAVDAGTYAGPIAAALPQLSEAARAAFEGLGPVTAAASGCRLVAIVLPAGARFAGYRYDAQDDQGAGECRADQDCPIGEARWLGHASVVRGSRGTMVYAVFENRSTQRSRQARLTVYFQPAPGWTGGAG